MLLVLVLAPAWHGGMAIHGARGVVRARDAVEANKPLRYEGGLLGVKADVVLYRQQERALIRLKGLPIGGTINGVASFKSDGCSVELDHDLEKALRRRRVRIVGAGADEKYTSVWVLIQLPFGLGRHKLVLPRTTV